MKSAEPHPASLEEIEDIIDGFGYAAEYLERAGFDGVEIHGAHGYLLAQFLSQSTNLRNDHYGGSLRNRARLTLEVAEAVRLRTSPDFVMGIKLNSVEFQDKGLTQEEAKQLCIMLEKSTFDFVELSGGTFEDMGFEHKKESTKHREAFFLEFADEITPALSKTKSYITGGFKTAAAMVRALDTVDGVGLGPAACQEPRLPKSILEGKVQAIIKQRPNDQHTALATIVAGSQIRQMSKDQEPFDMSLEENEKAFMKLMNTWMELDS
ncbi:uncharacterized protein N0V89_006451 [Didymosphaeria variabile]|uniref:NADH:flavin oxidoreductase/NADH oxidase N-terminal domain-containing protein n=1 Tax=Didymosphaeria variabile TaxID=1932322 RepID=A0A9W8XHM2_9PLEO|nr:uncharacterized protein N0V89_006451 [Didymosphaeria variabile]KAJ4351112.1 hypothetical protein N0V89_006451 [Didymosphaeria variabile]